MNDGTHPKLFLRQGIDSGTRNLFADPCLTCSTEVKVVGTFPVPFTEFLGESRSRGRHTECACYFCRTRQALHSI